MAPSNAPGQSPCDASHECDCGIERVALEAERKHLLELLWRVLDEVGIGRGRGRVVRRDQDGAVVMPTNTPAPLEERIARLERIVALAWMPPETPHPEVQHIWRLVLELRDALGIPADFDPWQP